MDGNTGLIEYLEWRATRVIGDLVEQGRGTHAQITEDFEGQRRLYEQRYGCFRSAEAANIYGIQETLVGILQKASRGIFKLYDPSYSKSSISFKKESIRE